MLAAQRADLTYYMHAAPEDFLFVLHRAAPWAQHWTLRQCCAMLDGSTAYVVAFLDQPVGCGRIISDGIVRAYIEDVAVLPEYRRLGVGEQIVARLEAAVGIVERIDLITEVTDFWVACGYTEKLTHCMVKRLR